MVEGDPANADALGAGGKPEVLDREAGAVQVGVGDRVPTEHFAAATVAVAADADAERGFANAFDLQVGVLAGAAVEVVGLDEPLTRGECLHRCFRLLAADQDEAPGLHQSDRGGLVGGLEQASEERFGERVGAEAADVATFGDRAPDTRTFVFGEAPAGGVVPAFAGA